MMSKLALPLLSFSAPRLSHSRKIIFLILCNGLLLAVALSLVFFTVHDYTTSQTLKVDFEKRLTDAKIKKEMQEALLADESLLDMYEKLRNVYDQHTFEEWIQTFCQHQGCSAVISRSTKTIHHSSGEEMVALPFTIKIQSQTDLAVFELMRNLSKKCPYIIDLHTYTISRKASPSNDPSSTFPYLFEAKIDAIVLSLVE